MKTFVAISILAIYSMACRAQVDYQPGYYITRNGIRTSCLIKDLGWLTSPATLICKSSPARATNPGQLLLLGRAVDEHLPHPFV